MGHDPKGGLLASLIIKKILVHVRISLFLMLSASICCNAGRTDDSLQMLFDQAKESEEVRAGECNMCKYNHIHTAYKSYNRFGH